MSKIESGRETNATSLHQLMFLLQHLSDELLSRETEVGLSQVRILAVLHSSKPRSQRLVAARLGQTESNVSRQVHIMKKQGLVSVTKNRKDGRQKDITVTAKGKRVNQKAERLLAAQHKELLKMLSSAEAKSFNKAVNHLLSALSVETKRSQKIFGSDWLASKKHQT